MFVQKAFAEWLSSLTDELFRFPQTYQLRHAPAMVALANSTIAAVEEPNYTAVELCSREARRYVTGAGVETELNAQESLFYTKWQDYWTSLRPTIHHGFEGRKLGAAQQLNGRIIDSDFQGCLEDVEHKSNRGEFLVRFRCSKDDFIFVVVLWGRDVESSPVSSSLGVFHKEKETADLGLFNLSLVPSLQLPADNSGETENTFDQIVRETLGITLALLNSTKNFHAKN